MVKRARVVNIDFDFEGVEPTEREGTKVRFSKRGRTIRNPADPWQVDPEKLKDVYATALEAFQYGYEIDVYVDQFGRITRVSRIKLPT